MAGEWSSTKNSPSSKASKTSKSSDLSFTIKRPKKPTTPKAIQSKACSQSERRQKLQITLEIMGVPHLRTFEFPIDRPLSEALDLCLEETGSSWDEYVYEWRRKKLDPRKLVKDCFPPSTQAAYLVKGTSINKINDGDEKSESDAAQEENDDIEEEEGSFEFGPFSGRELEPFEIILAFEFKPFPDGRQIKIKKLWYHNNIKFGRAMEKIAARIDVPISELLFTYKKDTEILPDQLLTDLGLDPGRKWFRSFVEMREPGGFRDNFGKVIKSALGGVNSYRVTAVVANFVDKIDVSSTDLVVCIVGVGHKMLYRTKQETLIGTLMEQFAEVADLDVKSLMFLRGKTVLNRSDTVGLLSFKPGSQENVIEVLGPNEHHLVES
ncbi:CYFA0S03e02267g1_1 [Cyberlindnera fabianii]|uniref:CYFA0S03e02267g1_1 n=1 Tax=Cyberlindnera fabianii TaxID=36022 RepID=A0A061AP52_CYBFA|nr:CYFA0S03e02267g1_1 [Cyberlindnera fabianii]